MAMLEHALSYASRGWPIFRVHSVKPDGSCTCGVEGCGDLAKHPMASGWRKSATSDIGEVKDLWTLFPNANIGVAAGPKMGAWILDIDGEIGEQSLAQLEEELGPLPQTLEIKTGSGGRHLYFAWPWGRKIGNRVKIRPGIDVRGEGGYALLPPSSHKSGGTYQLPEEGSRPAEAPKAWLDFVEVKKKAYRPPWEQPAPRARPASGGGEILERARAYLDRVPPAEQGNGGHNALMWAATCMVWGFCLNEDAALDLLWSEFNPRCSPPWNPDDARERRDFERKVSEAAKGGLSRHPRGWLLDAEPLAAALDLEVMRGEESARNLLASLEVLEEEEGDDEEPPRPARPPREEVPFRIPGFVSEVMDLTLATAPYPNEKLAFAGALALQAYLAHRKVRDRSDIRPNLYLLALARSGSGKEHPRKVNKLITDAAGVFGGVVDNVSSAQGLEDALEACNSMLFMLDEADALVRAMAGSKDQRALELHRALLTLYSASSSPYRMRARAGDPPKTIKSPHLTLLGTAIPKHFFEALTERMLTNGLVGRMLVIDSTAPRVGQEGRIVEVPERILEAAKWWGAFHAPSNNMGAVVSGDPAVKVVPVEVPSSHEAEEIYRAFRAEADGTYAATEGDEEAEGGRTVQARAYQTARKLGLLYAVSESRERPRIGTEAALWATGFARQQADRLLDLVEHHGVANPYEAELQRILRLLWRAPGSKLQRSKLLKKLKAPAKLMDDWISTLKQRGDVVVSTVKTGKRGRPATFYRLRYPAK